MILKMGGYNRPPPPGFKRGKVGVRLHYDNILSLFSFCDIDMVVIVSSVSDPYHFDADPDPRIRFRDDGSKQIPIIFFLIFSV